MMMTVAPPVVHPSLGLIALMHGVAAYPRQREEQIQHLGYNTRARLLPLKHISASPLCSAPTCLFHKDASWKLPPERKKNDGFVL